MTERYLKSGGHVVRRGKIDADLHYSTDQKTFIVDISSEDFISMGEFVDVLETLVLDLRDAQGLSKDKQAITRSEN